MVVVLVGSTSMKLTRALDVYIPRISAMLSLDTGDKTEVYYNSNSVQMEQVTRLKLNWNYIRTLHFRQLNKIVI